MPRDLSPGRHSWLLQRQRRLSRRQIRLLWCGLSVPALLVALPFTWLGYWHVLAHVLLHSAVLGLGLRHVVRHLDDYDRIEIGADGVLVEQARARLRRRYRFDTWSTRVTLPRRDRDPIVLQDGGQWATLGRLASAAERRQVARELCRCLPAHLLPERPRTGRR